MTTPLQLKPLEKNELSDYGLARVRDAAFEGVLKLWRNRQTEGWTQKRLAKNIGRDEATVSKYFRGPSNWTMRTLGELVQALEADIRIIIEPLDTNNVPEPVFEIGKTYAFVPGTVGTKGHKYITIKTVYRDIVLGDTAIGKYAFTRDSLNPEPIDVPGGNSLHERIVALENAIKAMLNPELPGYETTKHAAELVGIKEFDHSPNEYSNISSSIELGDKYD